MKRSLHCPHLGVETARNGRGRRRYAEQTKFRKKDEPAKPGSSPAVDGDLIELGWGTHMVRIGKIELKLRFSGYDSTCSRAFCRGLAQRGFQGSHVATCLGGFLVIWVLGVWGDRQEPLEQTVLGDAVANIHQPYFTLTKRFPDDSATQYSRFSPLFARLFAEPLPRGGGMASVMRIIDQLQPAPSNTPPPGLACPAVARRAKAGPGELARHSSAGPSPLGDRRTGERRRVR